MACSSCFIDGASATSLSFCKELQALLPLCPSVVILSAKIRYLKNMEG
ncbi:MAG: hypothetical protein Sv326_0711 [Candidatus Fermentimicrarchaeum limneticum]|uniref:Uncharacterized protein n=1 Tax=Fermentimicrarchaeum limneticum TaxID=2795018 RepID=A0A7D5XLM9_FERL1|nr:MAG: hypothetical protein Sv326_0711 [Candidatus Fermentimicrarchaeum limneticum]